MSRQEFGRYFRLIQYAYENKVVGYNTYNLFKNIVSRIKDKGKFSYLEFFICLETFKELRIIETNERDSEILNITNEKHPLNSSAFYNRLNTIKLSKD